MARKNISIFCFLSVVILLFILFISHIDKPKYLKNAEERVSSYLSNENGVMTCQSTKISEYRWTLNCLNALKTKQFEFNVLPEETSTSKTSDFFYLEAMNDDAKQSAHQGLMQYLNVITS